MKHDDRARVMAPIVVASFDLDGTLVDTAGEIAEAANRTIAEFGFERQPQPAIERLIGAGTRELMLRLVESLGGPGADDRTGRIGALLERFTHHYAATAGTSCRLYPGCAEALDRLQIAGVRLACLTNKEERYSLAVLRAMGIGECFELVVGGDTLAFKKPDPRVLQHIAKTLEVDLDEIAHIGDSRTDVETARNAGVAAWAVPWGYNGGEPIAAAQPDRVFADFDSVAAAVLATRAG